MTPARPCPPWPRPRSGTWQGLEDPSFILILAQICCLYTSPVELGTILKTIFDILKLFLSVFCLVKKVLKWLFFTFCLIVQNNYSFQIAWYNFENYILHFETFFFYFFLIFQLGHKMVCNGFIFNSQNQKINQFRLLPLILYPSNLLNFFVGFKVTILNKQLILAKLNACNTGLIKTSNHL